MKQPTLLISFLLLMSPAAPAVTFSDASLSGTYSVELSAPQIAQWSKTFSCPTNSNITFTVGFESNERVTQNVVHGTATFNGSGAWSYNVTQIGVVDSTASANTASVTWNRLTCQVTSQNPGHVVYKASSTQTGTGTYSVQSNGTGTLSSTSGGGVNLTFILAGTDASGIATTVLLSNPQVNGTTIGTGIAVHQ